MLKNYIVMAWRQIRKNKLYAAINILGLVTGLTVYIFGSLLVEYEESHDQFFHNADRIFTASSIFSPTSGVGVNQNDGVYTALGPIIENDVPEIEAIARIVSEEFLVTVDDQPYYERIRFTDSDFAKIFNFDYIEGDARALEDPSGIVLSETAARKFFGEQPALGKPMTLDHEVTIHVSAVFADLPVNTHFESSIIGDNDSLDFVAPLQVLNQATGYDLAGNWNNLSLGDMTYMLFPVGTTKEQVQVRLDGLYEAHFPEGLKEFITGMEARGLEQANTIIYDMVGMPILESVQILAFLVLVVAIVNYTNLATAQSLGRAREVGLRKTMGAVQGQLLAQFLVESICIVALSMLVTLAVLEVLVPLFNSMTGRGLVLDYLAIFPWLLATTILVGLVAGAYPAYLITRATPITALRDSGTTGVRGSGFRSAMLGLQFTISIFMLAMVIIVYLQNQKVIDSGDIYPRSQILTLKRLGLESIQARMETLYNELSSIDGVGAMTYSTQVPFDQSDSSFGVSAVAGDEDAAFGLMRVIVDEHFIPTYDIPLLAGRNLSQDVGGDTVREGVLEANVIVNEEALRQFGFGTAEQGVGSIFYDFSDDRASRAYTIVGVMPDQNFRGFHNTVQPLVFYHAPAALDIASLRIEAGVPMPRVVSEIEARWDEIVPEYPIQIEFLDETFNDVFKVFSLMTGMLGGFAVIALLLSAIGLFGLAAFMAQRRTREIGIRKVMGANVVQIVRLLIWQFSKPVMWSLLVSLPLAYFASEVYLQFFANRIAAPVGIVLGAGVVGVLFAWLIVALHAARVARANPIHALRYE